MTFQSVMSQEGAGENYSSKLRTIEACGFFLFFPDEICIVQKEGMFFGFWVYLVSFYNYQFYAKWRVLMGRWLLRLTIKILATLRLRLTRNEIK